MSAAASANRLPYSRKTTDMRIGIDLGGTKIEAIALADDGAEHLVGSLDLLSGVDEIESGRETAHGIGREVVRSPVFFAVVDHGAVCAD